MGWNAVDYFKPRRVFSPSCGPHTMARTLLLPDVIGRAADLACLSPGCPLFDVIRGIAVLLIEPLGDVGDGLAVRVQVPQTTTHLAVGHGLVVVVHVVDVPVGTADGPVLVQRLVLVLGSQQLDVLLRVAVQVQQVLSQLLGRLEVGRVDEGAGCGVLLSTHNTGTWIGTSVSRHGHMDWYVPSTQHGNTDW